MSTSPTSEPLKRVAPPWSALEAIAPVRLASHQDAVDGPVPERVVAPQTTEQVSATLAWANQHDVRTVARGGGSKLGWGNPPSGLDLVLSIENFAQAINHAWQDMTVTVSAGTTVAALQSTLAEHGQRLPLDVLWPERSTIGGVMATNDSGSLRVRFGSVRDLILGLTVVLANGTVARSGGRVVKNVAGYDLPKLFTGSFGTLGVITEVTLRTYPLPHCVNSLSVQFADAAAANRYILAIADTRLVPTGVQLRLANVLPPIVDVRFEGLEEAVAVQIEGAGDLASEGEVLKAPDDPWDARQNLWSGNEISVLGKFSVLPSAIAGAAQLVQSHGLNAAVVAQSVGLGWFRANIDGPEAVARLREAIEKIGGTLTLLQATSEIKKSIEVFGARPAAYPLMLRVKQQFDPKGILSPSRFAGGI